MSLFAFPYGDDGHGNGHVAPALERAGYRAAFTYQGNPIRLPLAEPYRVERVAMGPDTDLTEILERGEVSS